MGKPASSSKPPETWRREHSILVDFDGRTGNRSSALSRRELLRGGFAAAGSAVAASATTTACGPAGADAAGAAVVYPRALQAGDRVRIVAPARPGDARLARGIEILESFGLVVEFGAHVYDSYGYLAGT